MSLYWEDQLYERTEIREDTKELRAQGGLGDMQQAFTETLETKRLYSQTENHRVSLSLSLLECHPLFIITVFFPLAHPDQPLQLFARLHSSCLPVLNCLVTSQSSQICIKSFENWFSKKTLNGGQWV